MSIPSPGAGEPWGQLLSLARSSDRPGAFIEAVLGRWCAAHGAAHAALYVQGEGALGPSDLEVEAATDLAAFPRRLDLETWHGGRLELPHGQLVWKGGDETAEADDPLGLLLVALARLSRLRRRLARQSFETNYRGVELEALYDVGLAIASTLELDSLAEEILLRAVSLLDARRGALYLRRFDDPGDLVEHRMAVFGGAAAERFEPRPAGAESGDGGGPGGALEARLPEDLLPGALHRLPVPIEVDGERRGLLVMADKESRSGVGPFTDKDRRSLSLFANQAAIALENARLHREALEKERLERDLELAAEIQRQILPERIPEVEGYEVLGWSRSARHVGGDYYDLLRLEDGRLALVLGDVSGKGVAAALLVSTLHSAVRLLLDRLPVGPELFAKLNRHILAASAQNKFITLFIGSLVPEDGVLDFVNGGHNPAIRLRGEGGSGGIERLYAGGMPVGLLPGSTYKAATTTLAVGDLVCLFSDGITEAEAPDDEEFGDERLIEALRELADEPLETIVAEIDRRVLAFTRGAPQGDDQTVVLLRRTGTGASTGAGADRDSDPS